MNAPEIVWPVVDQSDRHLSWVCAYPRGTVRGDVALSDVRRLWSVECGSFTRPAAPGEFRDAEGAGEPGAQLMVLVVVCQCHGQKLLRRWPYLQYAAELAA